MYDNKVKIIRDWRLFVTDVTFLPSDSQNEEPIRDISNC